MRSLFRSFLFALPLAASAVACTVTTGATSGDNGKLQFETQQADCILFCGKATSIPILAGAEVTIDVSNGDPSTRYTASIDPPAAADLSLSTSCFCKSSTANSATSRSVDVGTDCKSGETKSCTESVSLDTKADGDVALQIFDSKGQLVDKTTVHLRPATSIASHVSVANVELRPATDGAFEVKLGSAVAIASSALGADGQALLYTRGAFLFTYADKSIARPAGDVLFGSSGVEQVSAIALGTTKITVAAKRGATRELTFRVIP